MEAKHTATPWSFHTNHNGSLDFFGEDGGRVIVCNARLHNQEANAAFIVRACNDHYENKRKAGLCDELVKAAAAVLSHRDGDLPARGWLQDNDASRAALAELAAALAKATAQ